MSQSAYSKPALERLLHERLEPVLSSRRTVQDSADQLSRMQRHEQDFVIRWAGVIARSNAELGYQFVTLAPSALEQMETGQAEAWVVRGMDTYDGQGLYPALESLRDIDGFCRESAVSQLTARYEDVAGVLTHYARGLSGRGLKLTESEEEHYTDTETMYLPSAITRLPDVDANFSLFKAMVANMWAQSWFGTFRRPAGQASLFSLEQEFPQNRERALALFSLLETVRLDACIDRDLPGLGRQMRALRQQTGQTDWPAEWQPWVERLELDTSSVVTTIEAVRELMDSSAPLPDPICYQSALRPEDVLQMSESRQQREQAEFQNELRKLAEEQGFDLEAGGENDDTTGFSLEQIEDADDPNAVTLELKFGDESVELPPNLQALVDSIIQDLGEVPEEYLSVDSEAEGQPGEGEGEPDIDDDESGEQWEYDEWDYRRQHYRKRWCTLREVALPPGEHGFVEQTLTKYAGTVTQLRKTFEAIRGENHMARRQSDGEGIDFDAVVEAVVERELGREMPDRLFIQNRKSERDMAVVFMVDVSGSTKGWINDAERESLVLLCEALETLGDRYAIFGFSGTTRRRCELFPIKRMGAAYDDDVRARITAMRPRDYTRMGVTIRHLTQLLAGIEARTKLLVTLSDGKPDDYDGYGGQYGIEDTRKALIEAKHAGIHPYCITIDSEAHDYLPHMYGEVNYAFVRDVRQLPLRVSDIYRRLTT